MCVPSSRHSFDYALLIACPEILYSLRCCCCCCSRVLLTDRPRPSQTTSSPTSKDVPSKKVKEEPAPELTPLEKMLQNAGPLREDGTDKFFGLENVSFGSHTQPSDRLPETMNAD